MELGLVLNDYLHRLSCTAKVLAEASGVSEIQISRWRNGTRRPSMEMLKRLASGNAKLSDGAFEEDAVLSELLDTIPAPKRNGNGLGQRLDLLLDALKIHSSEVSRILNFDPSYLSRIRSGQRNPSSNEPIIDGVSRYVARRCTSESERAAAAELIGTDLAALSDQETYRDVLAAWLRSGATPRMLGGADVSALLQTLDSFDLNEYIRSTRIREESERAESPQMPKERSVTGLKNMMRCELDFFRATALSDSAERVLTYSDMPMTELAKDETYPKQWMQAMAELLKKGLRVEMIHNIDRPFEELLLGLEVHIPLYMTGRITPYYLKESNSGPFRHLLEVSGAAALSGEAITGHQAEGRYTLTFDPREVRYYQKRAAALKGRAAPLVDIYTQEQEEEFRGFLRSEAERGHYPTTCETPAFRNITVQVCHDCWAIVTKECEPQVSFVIRHPKLVDAIERFAAPLADA